VNSLGEGGGGNSWPASGGGKKPEELKKRRTKGRLTYSKAPIIRGAGPRRRRERRELKRSAEANAPCPGRNSTWEKDLRGQKGHTRESWAQAGHVIRRERLRREKQMGNDLARLKKTDKKGKKGCNPKLSTIVRVRVVEPRGLPGHAARNNHTLTPQKR